MPVFVFIKWIRDKARIQANLASVGLQHYYLKSIHKASNTYIFKLLKGHKMAYENFIREFDNLKQLFGQGDIAYSRYRADMVKVQFKEALIDIDAVKTTKTKISLSKLLTPNRLLLGIASLQAKPIFATNKEEGKGLLNGHWLIVGASGSGKSVSVKSFCMNFLLKENYKQIDKIFVINYKQSSDYNFLKALNKVKYAQDIKEGLKLLKEIQLDMFNKYLYNSHNDQDNFTAYQTLVIIDEIQTLPEMLDSKGLHKVQRNSIQESLSIIEMLGSKARASNISLMVILQKADVSSLPSTAFRQNLRNRFMLKQENNVSASLVINSEILEKENIHPLDLKQGQFIYLDTLKNEVHRGLTLFPDTKIDTQMLNSLPFDKETASVIKQVATYKAKSIEAIKQEQNELESLAESGKKTYYDTFEDVELEEQKNEKGIDILQDVEELLK
ncbi:FtsK/SpoIIIE domain-containing protein [Sulfurimonas sp.]